MGKVKKEEPNTKNEADKENQQKSTSGKFEGKRVVDARRAPGEPREERNNQRNTEYRPREDGEGRGAGRGVEGGRGGKREFDRKSADGRSGVKAEDKRGGGGKGNWGTFEDDVPKEGEEANTTVDSEAAEAEPVVVEEPKAPRELTAEELQAKLEREEEEKQMTLQEWKAIQAKKDGPKFNLRKPGEGSDVDPKWKKATIYKKEAVDEDEEDEEESRTRTARTGSTTRGVSQCRTECECA